MAIEIKKNALKAKDSDGNWSDVGAVASNDTYALRSKYSDTSISVGRKANTVIGEGSAAIGTDVVAPHDNEASFGKYNESNDDTLFSVGDGTADDARHNAFEITTNGGKLHDKDIATTDLIPSTLPASGGNADYATNAGNADTVGGIQASHIRQITFNAVQTLPTPPIGEGDYHVFAGDSSFPYPYGNLSIRCGAGGQEFVAIYQTTGTDRNIWYNVCLQNGDFSSSWMGWRRVNDGGNADTVGGLHADDFARSYNDELKAYLNGQSGDIRALVHQLPIGEYALNTPDSEFSEITFPIEGYCLMSWFPSKSSINDLKYGTLIIRSMYSESSVPAGVTYICSVYNTYSYTDWEQISTTPIKSTPFAVSAVNDEGYAWTGITFPCYIIGVDIGHYDIIVQYFKGSHVDANRSEWAMMFFNKSDVTTPLKGSFYGVIYYIDV